MSLLALMSTGYATIHATFFICCCANSVHLKIMHKNIPRPVVHNLQPVGQNQLAIGCYTAHGIQEKNAKNMTYGIT